MAIPFSKPAERRRTQSRALGNRAQRRLQPMWNLPSGGKATAKLPQTVTPVLLRAQTNGVFVRGKGDAAERVRDRACAVANDAELAATRPSGCRGYFICFASLPKGRARKAKAGLLARVGAKAPHTMRAPPNETGAPCRVNTVIRAKPSASGFARKRRDNEAIRSFRREAETERAQFGPTTPCQPGRRSSLPPHSKTMKCKERSKHL